MPKKTTNECDHEPYKHGDPIYFCTLCKQYALYEPLTPTQCKDGTSFWESTRKWAEAKQDEKPLESTQCKDGNPDCGEDWEKDEFSVAVNIYGNECIRVALDSIKNCITDEERMIEWKSAAYKLIDLHKSLLSQQAKEVREDQKRIDAEKVKSEFVQFYKPDSEETKRVLDICTNAILSTNKES